MYSWSRGSSTMAPASRSSLMICRPITYSCCGLMTFAPASPIWGRLKSLPPWGPWPGFVGVGRFCRPLTERSGWSAAASAVPAVNRQARAHDRSFGKRRFTAMSPERGPRVPGKIVMSLSHAGRPADSGSGTPGYRLVTICKCLPHMKKAPGSPGLFIICSRSSELVTVIQCDDVGVGLEAADDMVVAVGVGLVEGHAAAEEQVSVAQVPLGMLAHMPAGAGG